MKRLRIWHLRKVKHGTVTIYGRKFRPSIPTQQLEGKVLQFAIYTTANKMEPYIYLAGTEEMYKECMLSKEVGDEHYKKFCDLCKDFEDGLLGTNYMFWYEVKEAGTQHVNYTGDVEQ